MKKFLIVGMASLSLTACTFWGGDNNADPSTHITVDTNRSEYESLYDAHASVRIEGLNNALEKTLAHLHQESIGDMSLSVVIPHMITAQFSTKIWAIMDGFQKAHVSLNQPKLALSGLMEGSFGADEVQFITAGMDSYVSYKNLNLWNLAPASVVQTLKQFEGKWIDMMDQETRRQMYTNIPSAALSSLANISLKDVTKYLREYRFFRQDGDAVVDGDVVTFPVVLDVENIIRLQKAISKDIFAQEMDAQSEANMRESLSAITIGGTMAFHKSNARYVDLRLTVSAEGMPTISMNYTADTDQFAIAMDVAEPQSVNFTLDYTKNNNTRTWNAQVSESGNPQGSLLVTAEDKDGVLTALDANLNMAGVPVTLRYARTGDNFTGNMNFLMGQLQFSGTVEKSTLRAFSFEWAVPGVGSVTANLTPSQDDFISGKLSVVSGETEILSSTLGLQMVGQEKFGVRISDLIVQGDTAMESALIEFKTNAQSKPSTKSVVIPTDVITIDEVVNALDAGEISVQ